MVIPHPFQRSGAFSVSWQIFTVRDKTCSRSCNVWGIMSSSNMLHILDRLLLCSSNIDVNNRSYGGCQAGWPLLVTQVIMRYLGVSGFSEFGRIKVSCIWGGNLVYIVNFYLSVQRLSRALSSAWVGIVASQNHQQGPQEHYQRSIHRKNGSGVIVKSLSKCSCERKPRGEYRCVKLGASGMELCVLTRKRRSNGILFAKEMPCMTSVVRCGAWSKVIECTCHGWR